MIGYDQAEATALLQQLVAIKSYPGEEHAVQQAIVEWFRAANLPVELWPTSAAPNVVVTIENGPGPTLLLNGHVDTVLQAEGWECDPWQGRIDGDLMYGLGAADMKSGVVVNMLVTRALAQHRELWSGTLIFSSVGDEEAFSIGANALIERGIAADYCLVSEPMSDIVVGATGKVLVKADVIGKAAHGFMPWQGVNAASEASRLVVAVDALPLGTHERIPSSQSILSFLSGSAQYVVTIPERAEVLISRQIVPGESRDSVLAQMQAGIDALQSPARVELTTPPPYYPPFEIDTQHPLVQAVQSAFQAVHGRSAEYIYSTGVSDGNLIAELAGIPTILHGPTGGNFHQCQEWVSLSSMVTCCDTYTRVIQHLLPTTAE